MVEATKKDGESEISGGVEDSQFLPSTFKDLVKDVTSNGQDIKAFTFKAKAVVIIRIPLLLTLTPLVSCCLWFFLC